MHVLAFDTCFTACSVAIWSRKGDSIVAARREAMERGHSERLVPMIAEVLVEAGLSLNDIETLAVTVGPGSFTGVRTGLSVARAFALANNLPLVGTTSLHVMAAAVIALAPGQPIAVAVATRDGFVYFQCFRADDADPLADARLSTVADAAREVATASHFILGSGAAALAAAATGRYEHIMSADDDRNPDAATLARLARHLPRLSPPQPLYLRAPDAKPQTPAPDIILAQRS